MPRFCRSLVLQERRLLRCALVAGYCSMGCIVLLETGARSVSACSLLRVRIGKADSCRDLLVPAVVTLPEICRMLSADGAATEFWCTGEAGIAGALISIMITNYVDLLDQVWHQMQYRSLKCYRQQGQAVCVGWHTWPPMHAGQAAARTFSTSFARCRMCLTRL